MRTPVLTKSFRTSGAIAAYRIAAASGDRTIAIAADPTDLLIGAVGSLDMASGDMADIVLVGVEEVQFGGNVSFGDPLTSDANGKAVAAAPSAGDVVRIIGFAQTDAADGDVGPYLAAPGVLATPAAP